MLARTFTGNITHTGSDAGANHIVTHNLGTRSVTVSIIYSDNGVDFGILNTVFVSGIAFGYQIQTITLNQVHIRIYNWNPRGANTATYTAQVTVQTIV